VGKKLETVGNAVEFVRLNGMTSQQLQDLEREAKYSMILGEPEIIRAIKEVKGRLREELISVMDMKIAKKEGK
jgi:hypothetical protein